MKGLKNYVVSFMDGEKIGITREEALGIVSNLNKGNMLVIRGGVYAVHQFKSLTRVEKSLELDMYELKGMSKDQFDVLYLAEALSSSDDVLKIS